MRSKTTSKLLAVVLLLLIFPLLPLDLQIPEVYAAFNYATITMPADGSYALDLVANQHFEFDNGKILFAYCELVTTTTIRLVIKQYSTDGSLDTTYNTGTYSVYREDPYDQGTVEGSKIGIVALESDTTKASIIFTRTEASGSSSRLYAEQLVWDSVAQAPDGDLESIQIHSKLDGGYHENARPTSIYSCYYDGDAYHLFIVNWGYQIDEVFFCVVKYDVGTDTLSEIATDLGTGDEEQPGPMFGYQNTTNPDQVYVITSRADLDVTQPVFYRVDLDTSAVEYMHTSSAGYWAEEYRMADLGSGVMVSGGSNYLYYNVIKPYLDATTRKYQITQFVLKFDGSIEAANLDTQDIRTTDYTPDMATDSTTAWASGYMKYYDEFVVVFPEELGGTEVVKSVDVDVTDWFDFANADLSVGSESTEDTVPVNEVDNKVSWNNNWESSAHLDLDGTPDTVYIYYGLETVFFGDFEITNMEGCGNWLFAESNWYHFEATYSDATDWENLDTCTISWSDGFVDVEAYYDVVEESWGLTSGSEIVRFYFDSAENKSATNLVVTYDFLLRNTIADVYDVDVTVWANTTVGGSASNTYTDYFNIYNLGGRAEYTFTNAGQKITKGDIFELEVDGGVGTAYASTIYRKLQHLRLLWKFSHETTYLDSQYSDEKYVSFGFDYCYTDEEGADYWVDGWYAKIGISSGFVSVRDFWSYIHVRWYHSDGELVGSSEYFYSFWNPEPDVGTTLWTDLWFNSLNASSVAGGRVSCEYYGMQDAAPWWAFWYSNWGPMLSNQTSSMYYMDLLGKDDEVIRTPQIKMVKVWCLVDKPSSTGSYLVQAKDYTAFNKIFAPPDPSPFYGLDTPEWVAPKVMDMPQGGMFGWIFQGLKNLLKALTPNLLGMWGIFVGFLDTVFGFAGWNNGFSTIISWITTFFTMFIDGVNWLVSIVTSVFQLFTALLTTIINVFVIFINQWVAMIGFGADLLTGVYTGGINLVTDYNLWGWMQLIGVAYIIWLFYLLVDNGLQAVADHFAFMFNLASFVFDIFLGIANFVLKLLSTLIESIPVVE